jgi:hypothetical protein
MTIGIEPDEHGLSKHFVICISAKLAGICPRDKHLGSSLQEHLEQQYSVVETPSNKDTYLLRTRSG